MTVLGPEYTLEQLRSFPINRCHQRVVTQYKLNATATTGEVGFPINRCHQRVVTYLMSNVPLHFNHVGFQSIGVTSEW